MRILYETQSFGYSASVGLAGSCDMYIEALGLEDLAGF